MRRVRHVLGWLLIAALGACGSEVPDASDELVVREEAVDLGFFAQGITTSPDGNVFLLAGNQVFERIEGEWTHRWTAAPGTQLLEDIVALGEDRFALTTRNMGYELDLTDGALTQHFCYVPGDDIREEDPPQTPTPTVEISRSVAYAIEENLIVANPQTITDDVNQRPMFSEVAIFDRTSGDELQFRNLRDADFSAGGLVVLDFPTLLAGEGATLVEIDFETGNKRAFLGLGGLDIADIEGLAIDRDAGELLVLDGLSQRIVTLDLAQVEAAR